ncbi:MAG: hypothetical protein KUG75_13290 [Pseudomonadales bacterium]|nr:hypothetical protein [Pseudomonadales bacterium]
MSVSNSLAEDIRQEINLYSTDLLPPRVVFNLSDAAIVCSLFLALLVILTIWDHLDKNALLESRDELRSQLESISNLTEKVRAASDIGRLPSIKHEIGTLTQERNKFIHLLSSLVNIETSSGGQFSGYMRELAESRVDGVWLTSIRLKHGGAHIALEGKMLKASLLPDFLNQLSSGTQFHGHKFEQFEIVSEEPSVLGFSMQGPYQDVGIGIGGT